MECGVIKLYEYNKDRLDDYYRHKKDLQKIKCYFCEEKGHLNCGNISGKDKIYKRSLIEQVERDKRRILREKNKKEVEKLSGKQEKLYEKNYGKESKKIKKI